MDSVTVYPEQGEFPRIARALLDAADDPKQVMVVSHPRMGFVVPEDVFDRFQAVQQEAWEREEEGETSPVEPDSSPPPKRRGRPRKNPAPEQKVEER